MEFFEPVAPGEGEFVVQKRSVSAFVGTELERLLLIRDISTLVLAGGITKLRRGGDGSACLRPRLPSRHPLLWNPALRRHVDADDLDGAEAAWERTMNTRDETYFARERGEAVSDEPAPEEEAEPIEMFDGEGYEGLATAVMTAAVRRLRMPLILNVPNRGAMPDWPTMTSWR